MYICRSVIDPNKHNQTFKLNRLGAYTNPCELTFKRSNVQLQPPLHSQLRVPLARLFTSLHYINMSDTDILYNFLHLWSVICGGQPPRRIPIAVYGRINSEQPWSYHQLILLHRRSWNWEEVVDICTGSPPLIVFPLRLFSIDGLPQNKRVCRCRQDGSLLVLDVQLGKGLSEASVALILVDSQEPSEVPLTTLDTARIIATSTCIVHTKRDLVPNDYSEHHISYLSSKYDLLQKFDLDCFSANLTTGQGIDEVLAFIGM